MMFEQSGRSDIRVLCVNISSLSRYTQFMTMSLLVLVFYIIYGYFQELIFRLDEFKPFGWYLTLIQFSCYIVFAFVEHRITHTSPRKIPLSTYSFIAGLTVATMGLSNSSIGYLNYATQVIFKSCKLIPVLIGGILIQGKVFNLLDMLACVCMSVGVIIFTLADSSVSPSFNPYGILLICLALCADAVIGNVQEKVMKKYQSDNIEMVLYSYAIGFTYIFVGVTMKGEMGPAFTYCLQNPQTTYLYAVVMSLSGYLGLSVVLNLIKNFGALITVTVTTCRKAITIILSFTFFSKPFTFRYVWAGGIVLLGVYLNAYSKNRDSWNTHIRQFMSRVRKLIPRLETPALTVLHSV